jgi:hypothetical protein
LFSAVLRYWRRLRRSTPREDGLGDERDEEEQERGLSAYEPRSNEEILADVTAKGRDESRDIDRGAGLLIITSKAVVFSTDRKKWRFPKRNIVRADVSENGTFSVETQGGKLFSFVALTADEKKELVAAVDEAFGDTGDE